VTDADASLLEMKFTAALAERDAVNASLRNTIASLQATIEALQSTLLNHANENEILKRRLYGTKTERGGTSELQLLLGDLLSQQAVLQKPPPRDDAISRRPRSPRSWSTSATRSWRRTASSSTGTSATN